MVAAGFLEQQACGAARRLAVGNRRQRFDVERDGVECVLGQRRAVGDNDGDRLADVAHFVVGDDRLLVRRELRQQLQPQADGWDFGQIFAGDIGGSEDGVHAGTLARRRSVDRTDAAVRDRASQEHGMQRAGARHVVDELAAAAQEPQVLQALDRAADRPV